MELDMHALASQPQVLLAPKAAVEPVPAVGPAAAGAGALDVPGGVAKS